MKRQLLETEIEREPGKLYYCGTSTDGNITVCETLMKRGRKKKGEKK